MVAEAENLHNLQEHLIKRIEESELFTKRFGSFQKSDYEALMFTIYLDSLERPARDYDISIALGITENKVRTLRTKSQLIYPREINWVAEIASNLEHGYYDRTQRQVTITIEDPSVQSLVKNIIETNFGIVGRSLNTKQLVLPIESFLLLAAKAESDEKTVLGKLNQALKKECTAAEVIEGNRLTQRFLSPIADTIGFIGNLSSIYSAGNLIIGALQRLIGA